MRHSETEYLSRSHGLPSGMLHAASNDDLLFSGHLRGYTSVLGRITFNCSDSCPSLASAYVRDAARPMSGALNDWRSSEVRSAARETPGCSFDARSSLARLWEEMRSRMGHVHMSVSAARRGTFSQLESGR